MRSMSNVQLVLSDLVAITVKVLPATKDRETQWHKCHEHRDGSLWRTDWIPRCSGCGEDVVDLVPGRYDDAGQLVTVSGGGGFEPKGIFLQCVVHGDELNNPVVWGKPFVLEPNVIRKSGGSAVALAQYATVRTVLAESGWTLIVRHVLRDGDKPKLACVRAIDTALIMQNIVWGDEVNDVAELPILAQQVEPDLSAVKVMVEMLDRRTTDWDHAKFADASVAKK